MDDQGQTTNNPKHQETVKRLIRALETPSDQYDILCCDGEDGFSLSDMTPEEEKQFRAALTSTTFRVVSFPLGALSWRFVDLFGDGESFTLIGPKETCLFMPVRVFVDKWYREANGKISKNILALCIENESTKDASVL